jgi:hypothetical protein
VIWRTTAGSNSETLVEQSGPRTVQKGKKKLSLETSTVDGSGLKLNTSNNSLRRRRGETCPACPATRGPAESAVVNGGGSRSSADGGREREGGSFTVRAGQEVPASGARGRRSPPGADSAAAVGED